MTEENTKDTGESAEQKMEKGDESNIKGEAKAGAPHLQLPPPTIVQLLETFYFQAMISLGKQMNPMSRKYERDLVMAQYQIGVLELLQEKTQGNLSKEEADHLENLLHNLHVAYIDEAGKEEKK